MEASLCTENIYSENFHFVSSDHGEQLLSNNILTFTFWQVHVGVWDFFFFFFFGRTHIFARFARFAPKIV